MDINKLKDSFKARKYAFNFVYDIINNHTGDVVRIEYIGSTNRNIEDSLNSCLADIDCYKSNNTVEIVSFNFTLTTNFEDGTKKNP